MNPRLLLSAVSAKGFDGEEQVGKETIVVIIFDLKRVYERKSGGENVSEPNERLTLLYQTDPPMNKIKTKFFKALARLNKYILPRYSRRDLNKLNKLDKMLIAYRYYITKNALDS